MKSLPDLIPGQKFTCWTYQQKAPSRYGGRSMGLFKCDCGTLRELSIRVVTTQASRSCGCRRGPLTSKRKFIHGASVGKKITPEYRAFRNAKRRCSEPNNKSYADYGGRGIEFRFSSFQEFLECAGARPTHQHSLDRIDNDGHYELGNVRWATRTQQNRNKRNLRLITFHGQTRILAEWAENTGIGAGTLTRRLKSGWSIEKTLTTSVGHRLTRLPEGFEECS